MQSKSWIPNLTALFTTFLMLGVGASAWGQEDGKTDLDKASEAKLSAKTTKDLDAVVKLCESAIEKGLSKEDEVDAKQLAAFTLFEHADQLGKRIFAGNGQDTRWRIYRSQALSRLRKAIEMQPDMAEAHLMIAKLNGLPGGDQDEALEAIEKAVELTGDDEAQLSDALFLRAKLTDDEETRIADLNQAIKINPDNIEAVRRRANYYLAKREPKAALPDLKKWLDSDSKNVENHIVVVTNLLRMGSKFDEEIQGEALDIIDTAIELEPDNTLTHTLRAQLSLIGEKPDDAIADASRAIKLDRKNVGALMIRASVLSEKAGKEDLAAALDDVKEVLEIVPYHIEGIQLRGIIYSQQRNLKNAIEDFKLLAENDRSNQFYQRQLAMLYNADEQPSRAVRIYTKLIDQNSLDNLDKRTAANQILLLRRRFAALRGAGDARLSTGDHAKAINNYNEALDLAKRINELEEQEEVEELTPLDDGVLNNLAWVLATTPKDDLRDGKRAIQLATQAAEITKFKEAHIMSTLASGYAESGDFDKAIEWIEKAIELNQKNGKDGTVDQERTKEQRASLQKEFDSYKKKEPWRELQDVEKEKAEKAAKEKATEEKSDQEENDK
ncbi:MAG: tetratricopeptide repeat protein [Mariniblastus sp.]|nr:tetratricopeptide repeat protein [Mariniblastus sp.]